MKINIEKLILKHHLLNIKTKNIELKKKEISTVKTTDSVRLTYRDDLIER